MADAAPVPAPFPQLNALSTSILEEDSDERSAYLPGDASINLVAAEVRDYLGQELTTAVIEELYNKLWLVARKGGQNIDSLSRQKCQGKGNHSNERNSPPSHLVP